MSEILIYDAPLGADIGAASENACSLAWVEGRPVRFVFDGIEVTAHPGDTSKDLVDRWWDQRNMHQREVTASITIELTRGGSFNIRLGDHYHEELCWDEMLGCLARLTISGDPTPEKAGFGGLKTKEGWQAWRDQLKRASETLDVSNGND